MSRREKREMEERKARAQKSIKKGKDIQSKNKVGSNVKRNSNAKRNPNDKNHGDFDGNLSKNKASNVNNVKNPKNKKKKKGLKIVLAVLLAIVIVLGAIFGKYLIDARGSVSGAFFKMMKDVSGDQEPIFVLVMGVSEDISAELTDTIMLAGYNPDTNQAFVVSIPRDTFVGSSESSAGGMDKINALYQKSPQKTVEAVEKLTGVNIDYYVTVKTSALVDIVNSIGGVNFDVPINMDYDDPTQNLHIHLKAGQQVLNGDQAEQVVRFRHNNNGTTYSSEYGDNDEGRMRTQREFLKVVAKQVISWNNIDKIKEITTAVFKNLETDITLSKVLGYVPYVAEFNTDNLSMEQLPGTPAKINDLWFYKADSTKVKELISGYVDKLGLTDSEKAKYLKSNTKTNTSTTKTNTTKSANTTKSSNTTKNTSTTNTTARNSNSTNNTTADSTVKNTSANTTSKNTTTENKKNETTTQKENTTTSTNNTSSNKTNENNVVKEDTVENQTKNEIAKENETSSEN